MSEEKINEAAAAEAPAAPEAEAPAAEGDAPQKKARPGKNFRQNYIESLSAKDYALMYIKVPISDRIFHDFT